jgi:cell division protein FtsB
MARALLGYVGNSSEQALAMEIARLRRRVTELETEIADLRNTNHADLDRELHRFAEAAEPALA